MDISPLFISLRTAIFSIVITFFTGIFLARWIESINSEKVKTILDGILTLPMVLPPTVAGFILLCLFGVEEPLGKFFLDVFNVRIVFSFAATVIAAVTISLPLMYRSARGAFEQIDENLIYAARTLGMTEWKIFWKVIIPLSMPGIVSGGILAFARGLGEFGATAMIAGNIAGKTRTLSLAIYTKVSAGDMNGAWNYVLVISIVSFLAITLINYISWKWRNKN